MELLINQYGEDYMKSKLRGTNDEEMLSRQLRLKVWIFRDLCQIYKCRSYQYIDKRPMRLKQITRRASVDSKGVQGLSPGILLKALGLWKPGIRYFSKKWSDQLCLILMAGQDKL